jgi:predicted nucleotide-binding protein (sugar kinase/HSP70/actin superfamily)
MTGEQIAEMQAQSATLMDEQTPYERMMTYGANLVAVILINAMWDVLNPINPVMAVAVIGCTIYYTMMTAGHSGIAQLIVEKTMLSIQAIYCNMVKASEDLEALRAISASQNEVEKVISSSSIMKNSIVLMVFVADPQVNLDLERTLANAELNQSTKKHISSATDLDWLIATGVIPGVSTRGYRAVRSLATRVAAAFVSMKCYRADETAIVSHAIHEIISLRPKEAPQC